MNNNVLCSRLPFYKRSRLLTWEWEMRGRTEAGRRCILLCSCWPDLWSKLTVLQNWCHLMWNAHALLRLCVRNFWAHNCCRTNRICKLRCMRLKPPEPAWCGNASWAGRGLCLNFLLFGGGPSWHHSSILLFCSCPKFLEELPRKRLLCKLS